MGTGQRQLTQHGMPWDLEGWCCVDIHEGRLELWVLSRRQADLCRQPDISESAQTSACQRQGVGARLCEVHLPQLCCHEEGAP